MDHSLRESVIKTFFYKKILLQRFLLTDDPKIFLLPVIFSAAWPSLRIHLCATLQHVFF